MRQSELAWQASANSTIYAGERGSGVTSCGAGDGNRTRTVSLGNTQSTRHPRSSECVNEVARLRLWVSHGLAGADDVLVHGSGDGVVAAVYGVLVAEGSGRTVACPRRRCRSAVDTPGVAAASVAPVCRSQCTRAGGKPQDATARANVEPKLRALGGVPVRVPNTSASSSSGTCAARCSTIAAATKARSVTVRRPAPVLVGPNVHSPAR